MVSDNSALNVDCFLVLVYGLLLVLSFQSHLNDLLDEHGLSEKLLQQVFASLKPFVATLPTLAYCQIYNDMCSRLAAKMACAGRDQGMKPRFRPHIGY